MILSWAEACARAIAILVAAEQRRSEQILSEVERDL
jgi:hypothetical protein